MSAPVHASIPNVAHDENVEFDILPDQFDPTHFDPETQESHWLNQARALRLHKRRLKQGSIDQTTEAQRDDSPVKSLNPAIGIAFSGGGVRSATFNLGVLQALASHGVLDKVGYISSVSGGSYINSWLASWISKAGFDKVNVALADHEFTAREASNAASGKSPNQNPENGAHHDVPNTNPTSSQSVDIYEHRHERQRPISHLRHYSSYLTPHSGWLSSDVWAAVAAYVLRLLPNVLFVLLAAGTLIAAPYVEKAAYFYTSFSSLLAYDLRWVLRVFVCVVGLLAFLVGKKGGYESSNATASRKAAFSHAIATFVAILAFGPTLSACGSYLISSSPDNIYDRVGVGAFLFLLPCATTFLFGKQTALFSQQKVKGHSQRIVVWFGLTSIVGFLSFTFAARVFAVFFSITDPELSLALPAVFGPLLLFLSYLLMASVGVAVLPYDSGSQEWLNRIWGDTAILTIAWTAVAALSQLWPQLVNLFGLLLGRLHLEAQPSVWSAICAAGGWLLTTISGIISAFSSKTSGSAAAVSAPTPWRIRTKEGRSQYPLENVLARIAPYVFIIGLLVLVSSVIYHINESVEVPLARAIFFVLSCVLTFLLGRTIDVNRLSLHNFYRFRLIEAYLAASRTAEAENLRLADLCPPTSSFNNSQPDGESDLKDAKGFDGPFPIINCTLNVTKGDSLDLQKRRARNFVFTPTASGFTRYGALDSAARAKPPLHEKALIPASVCASDASPTLTLETHTEGASNGRKSITLGAAMAISGAAQSPNQGSHTSPAVAALLTLANIRLGWWLGNPRNDNTRVKEGPDNGFMPMLDELTAQATDEKEYVYLSDGGHFENLGLYELVRRRCKLIFLCDADCDPGYRFEDLVNAMELCKVDFGATITIDTDPLQNTLKAGWCRSAFTVGTIEYPKFVEKSETGIIVYLKSAVTRQNSMVVHAYDRLSKDFPHEPTTNQWFNETQFEAYRLLGLETAKSAIEALTARETLGHYASCGEDGRKSYERFTPPLWWNNESDVWHELVAQAERLL